MSSDSRASMVRSAAALIGSQGLSATSFSDVLADSGAPRGSIYHHFPDGKRQLAEDAVRWTSERVLTQQRKGDPATGAEVLEQFIGSWQDLVRSSDGTAGCVVAGVALDTSMAEPGLLELAGETFQSWVALLVEQLTKVGVPAARATPIAWTTVAGVEGALILCRAEGNASPLDTIAIELLRLLP